jgi:hypothetical protein
MGAGGGGPICADLRGRVPGGADQALPRADPEPAPFDLGQLLRERFCVAFGLILRVGLREPIGGRLGQSIHIGFGLPVKGVSR